MSKQIISSSKITKYYQLSNSSHGYNENPKYLNNKIKESFPQTRITKEIHKKFTGHGPTNIASFQYSENYVSTPSRIRTLNQTNLMQNNIVNNLDSSIGSLQRSSANSQSIGAYGSKWKTNTNSTYNKTIKTNLTGEGYCTCDDAKESSNGCTCYKRNTNNTLNKTLGSNDQNIYIQEGSSTDYCNCDEKKIFSNSNSEYNENTHNLLTDEELTTNNYCTCGQNHISTIDSSGKMQYSTNYMTSSPVQTTDYEEREVNGLTDVTKVVKTQVNVEVIRRQIREQVKQEIEEEQKEEEITWNGDNHIQVQ
jgi:hypothetical protein